MRVHKVVGLFFLSAGAAMWAAQGLTTNAKPDDWEEINFEFNSSILSDGYPSLLRLAELLHQHPDFTVTLEGNADWIGSSGYNLKLSRQRGETVEKFLTKYGAAAGQISILAHGKSRPSVPNTTREGRFINRRVNLAVRDAQGKVVSAEGVSAAIQALQAQPAVQQAAQQRMCCEDILKRLDKLDEILAAIKDLKAENDKLKQDVAALKQGQAGVEKQVAELPRAPDKAEMQKMMQGTADEAIEKAKPSRFSLLGINVGPAVRDVYYPASNNQNGTFILSPVKFHAAPSITFSGKGRYFAPFGKDETHALQAEAEVLYYRDRQEGQFDIGLVNRWDRIQAGAFASFKHANISDLGGGGNLGQAAFTLDWLFSRGRIGFFGTKAYLTDPVISRVPTPLFRGLLGGGLEVAGLNYNLLNEYFLRVVDQAGVSGQVGLWDNAYLEGNFGGLFRSLGGNTAGGMVRLVQPITNRVALTAEGSVNETLVGAKGTGRLAFGVQFGNWIRPKDFLDIKSPVPVDIPRIRYEVGVRQVRVGVTPPVADAGPNQIGVAAGTITLDASGSYSPEGLTLSYQWSQIGGPTVQLSNANAVRATFTAVEGATYQFRVTVTDTLGSQATARTTVTVKTVPSVAILNFAANPASINSGESSTLVWQVQNADTVTITPDLGTVAASGSKSVSPTQTTTYTLTATNTKGTVTQTVTITVNQPQIKIVDFQVNPGTISAGQSALLYWQTQNADSVSISGVGAVAANGSTSVSPAVTTTYTLTATNRFGQVTATVTVTVTTAAPIIVSFTANPPSIVPGQSSNLSWEVKNASKVSISGIGDVAASGSKQVSPAQTTTYTLTATGPGGEVTQSVTVTVTTGGEGGTAIISSFTANPTTVTYGQTATLTWTSQNGMRAFITSVGPVPLSGSVVVKPDATTTYRLEVQGTDRAASQSVTITVNQPPAGGPPIAVIAGNPNVVTTNPTIFLDACHSVGKGLTFIWGVDKQVLWQSIYTCSTSVTLPAYDTYRFNVTVRDDQDRYSVASVTVTLRRPTSQ